MRIVIAMGLLTCLAGAADAQVPGTVGPPPDSRMSPGSEGPTIACRLFDVGCKRPPEPTAAPAPEAQAAPLPSKPRKAKPKPKRKPTTDAAPASADEQ